MGTDQRRIKISTRDPARIPRLAGDEQTLTLEPNVGKKMRSHCTDRESIFRRRFADPEDEPRQDSTEIVEFGGQMGAQINSSRRFLFLLYLFPYSMILAYVKVLNYPFPFS